MTTEDDKPEAQETIGIKTRCEVAPDGQHKWIPKEGYMVCEHCKLTTKERLLFD